MFLATLLLCVVYPLQIPFDKGIEIVRTRDYELVGDQSLEEKVSGSEKLIETDFREFMDACKAMKGND